MNARDVIDGGRAAGARWRGEPLETRVGALAALRQALSDDLDGWVGRIVDATGKAPVDALTGDLMTCLDFLAHYEREAPRILASRPLPGPPLFVGSRFSSELEPLGVVLILSPWNYPLQLALIPLAGALVAGNAVVLKPSEVAPVGGEIIEELCAAAGLPERLVQVVFGGPEEGAALVDAAPDKIFFTGSVDTGRKVARAAAGQLVCVELELGGKDPLLVFGDANLPRAVDAAVYGAFANAGQVCVGIERVYVERRLYPRFVSEVERAAAQLTVADPRGKGLEEAREIDVGAMIDPRQIAIVEAHVADALRRGARARQPLRREGALLWPLVLSDVDHEMLVMREETFGPVLPVMPFDDEEEAVALANDSIYGLNGAVFSADLGRARRVARRLELGSCAINDVLKNIGNPHAPFGGTKKSGWGRYHGDEGITGFCRQLSLMENSGALRREVNWFPWSAKVYETVRTLLQATRGAGQRAGEGARAGGERGALALARSKLKGWFR